MVTTLFVLSLGKANLVVVLLAHTQACLQGLPFAANT